MFTNESQCFATSQAARKVNGSQFRTHCHHWLRARTMALALGLAQLMGAVDTLAAVASEKTHLDQLLGQPVDIAGSAYRYRADRRSEENPPESWILLMQHAGLPYDKPVDVKTP